MYDISVTSVFQATPLNINSLSQGKMMVGDPQAGNFAGHVLIGTARNRFLDLNEHMRIHCSEDYSFSGKPLSSTEGVTIIVR